MRKGSNGTIQFSYLKQNPLMKIFNKVEFGSFLQETQFSSKVGHRHFPICLLPQLHDNNQEKLTGQLWGKRATGRRTNPVSNVNLLKREPIG